MLKFYYAPYSRAASIRWLLEELEVEREEIHIDIRAEGGVPESYRAIQPSKKVPAIKHDGVVITERAAISIYLADAFPQAGLAPAIGDPRRGRYLTWTVYADSVFDPCLASKAHGLTYQSGDYSFGLFDDMVANLERHFSDNEYAVGDRFTAADTQLASGVHYGLYVLPVLPKKKALLDYVARIADRPAFRRAQERDTQEARAMPFFQHLFRQQPKDQG